MKETEDKERLDNIATFLIELGFKGFLSSQCRGMFVHELFPLHIFDLSAHSDTKKDITNTIFKEIVRIGERKKQAELRFALGILS